MIGNSAHFASRRIRRFGNTTVKRSASGEKRMYGSTSAPAVTPMYTDCARSSASHPITVKLASVFRKLSFTTPKKLVTNSGTNDLPFMVISILG